MRKLIVVAHISLDGYVADAAGRLDGFEAGEENLQFVCSLTKDADAALFGRVSYELLDKFWPAARDRVNATPGEVSYSDWYNSAHKIVLSGTMPDMNKSNTTIIRANVAEEVERIKQEEGKDILIFGSPSASLPLRQAGLVDEYRIFINPVIFGSGIPLFVGSVDRRKLKLLSSRRFVNGEVALHYTV